MKFFDMDGTITESKQLISPQMKKKLFEIMCPGNIGVTDPIVVISGASTLQIQKQLDGLPCIIMGQSGNDTFLWKNFLTLNELQEIYTHISMLEITFPQHFSQTRYDFIENRRCQVALSFTGHNEDSKIKSEFDANRSKRNCILETIPFQSETLAVRIAGTTCLDYTKKNGTKGKNIERWIKQNKLKKEDCVYYGDALFKGGNDETVIGIIKTIEVKDPEDLCKKLQEK